MNAALREYAPFVALFGAFWTALLLYRARAPEGDRGTQLIVGLGLSPLVAHLGWVALNPLVALAQPALVLDPTRGFTVLFVPLGFLVAARWSGSRSERARFLANSLGALPLALAVARVGCLLGGCCHGIPTSLPWGIVPPGGDLAVHPTPAYEIGLLLALHFLTRVVHGNDIPALVLAGFGAVRIAVEPLRAVAPLGAPLVSVWIPALLWIAAGSIWAARTRGAFGHSAGERQRETPGPSQSSIDRRLQT